MNEEESTPLPYRKAPRFYRGHTKPIADSQMSCGFKCGDGWFDIIRDLSQQITEYAARHPELADMEMLQVKERLGTLRCFVRGADLNVRELIREAGMGSLYTCEMTC